MISQAQIEEVKNRIVNKFHPEKIILFGSYVEGNPTEESDLDLLIIWQTDLARKERRPLFTRELRDLKIPMDILVYTPQEIDFWSDTPLAFVSQIVKEGKVLYE